MLWFSVHFYPLETTDVFLTRAVKPFLEQYVWNTKGARAFFIRYADEKGPHIRLRIRGEATWIEEMLRPAFEGWMRDRGTYTEVPYLAEVTRFQNETMMAWAEEHFHISTRVILDRLNQPTYTYGDAMYDALRMHTIVAFTANFSHDRASWYFNQLCDQWLPVFLQPADGAPFTPDMRDEMKEQYESLYEKQKDDLRLAIHELWLSLERKKTDTKHADWIRWLRGNEMVIPEFGDHLDKILPSLIHLTNNRLGIQNADEPYLNYILSRTV